MLQEQPPHLYQRFHTKEIAAQQIFFQLKKLVYVYLVRYAEEQQDLALLSISTFQRALKVSMMLISKLNL